MVRPVDGNRNSVNQPGVDPAPGAQLRQGAGSAATLNGQSVELTQTPPQRIVPPTEEYALLSVPLDEHTIQHHPESSRRISPSDENDRDMPATSNARANSSCAGRSAWDEGHLGVGIQPGTARPGPLLAGQRTRHEEFQEAMASNLSKIQDLEKWGSTAIDGIKELRQNALNELQAKGPDASSPALQKLQQETDRLHAAAELRHLIGHIEELASWKVDVRDLDELAKSVMMHLGAADATAEIPGLPALRSLTEQRHAAVLREHTHSAAVAGILRLGDTAAELAAAADGKSPRLKHALEVFGATRSRCGYDPGATADELAQRRSHLENACNYLIDELTRPSGSADKLTEAMILKYGSIIERAESIIPETAEQADLKARLKSESTSGNQRPYMRLRNRAALSAALLDRVRHDAARTPLKPRPDGEAEYFRELDAHGHFIQDIVIHGWRDRANHDQRFPRTAPLASYSESLNLIDEFASLLPTALSGSSAQPQLWHGSRSTGDDPDRYRRGLITLRSALRTAEAIAAAGNQRLIADIDGEISRKRSGDRSGAQRAGAMATLVNGAADVLLQTLSPEKQIEILRALRPRDAAGKTVPQEALPEELRQAQSKVYKATQLDGRFLQAEKACRSAVIAHLLSRQAADLRSARDNWLTSSPEQRRQIMQQIVYAHCDALDIGRPTAVRLESAGRDHGAHYSTSARDITINPDFASFDDFEAMSECAYHENCHSWQHQLVGQVRRGHPGIGADSPLYRQAKLFEANWSYYDSTTGSGGSADWLAYPEQPMEAHAFKAGSAFARDLMRALDAPDA